jgi:hypothetical protein
VARGKTWNETDLDEGGSGSGGGRSGHTLKCSEPFGCLLSPRVQTSFHRQRGERCSFSGVEAHVEAIYAGKGETRTVFRLGLSPFVFVVRSLAQSATEHLGCGERRASLFHGKRDPRSFPPAQYSSQKSNFELKLTNENPGLCRRYCNQVNRKLCDSRAKRCPRLHGSLYNIRTTCHHSSHPSPPCMQCGAPQPTVRSFTSSVAWCALNCCFRTATDASWWRGDAVTHLCNGTKSTASNGHLGHGTFAPCILLECDSTTHLFVRKATERRCEAVRILECQTTRCRRLSRA